MYIKNMFRKVFNAVRGANPYTTKKLCGLTINVLPGTCRPQADQDDAWWFYLAKHHHVIFDIGCNIGYTALLALIQNPDRRMILVDPNPKALQKAAMNIINNNLGNRIQYLTAFVSDKLDDTVKFYTVGAGAAGSMYATHAKTAASMDVFIDVNTVTLDYIYEFYNLKPDLVKIDVEGAETLVMEGAKKMARETGCTFFVEMHTVEDLGMEAAGQLMIDWCTSMGYKAWYLKTASELKHAEMIKSRGKCHLLLLPETEPYPEYLKGIRQNAPLPNSI